MQLADGSTVEVEAFVPDLGGPNGAVAVSSEDPERSRLAAASGAYVSTLGTGYRQFRDVLFRATLDDWGWFGDSQHRPVWYTGMPWT
jgi:hypothetical protein